MSSNQPTKMNGNLFGQLAIIMFVIFSFTCNGYAGSVTDNQLSHPGKLGDRINYRTGELTLGSMDVTQQERHGLNLSIAHSYSSQIYDLATVDSAFQHREYTKC